MITYTAAGRESPDTNDRGTAANSRNAIWVQDIVRHSPIRPGTYRGNL